MKSVHEFYFGICPPPSLFKYLMVLPLLPPPPRTPRLLHYCPRDATVAPLLSPGCKGCSIIVPWEGKLLYYCARDATVVPLLSPGRHGRSIIVPWMQRLLHYCPRDPRVAPLLFPGCKGCSIMCKSILAASVHSRHTRGIRKNWSNTRHSGQFSLTRTASNRSRNKKLRPNKDKANGVIVFIGLL